MTTNSNEIQPKFSIQIRITHPSMDLSVFTNILKRKPQWCWKVGDRKRGINGQTIPGRYKNSYWLHTELNEGRDFFRKVLETASAVEINTDFRHSFLESGGEMTLVVGLQSTENIGSTMSAKQLSKIASLGFSLGIELFIGEQVYSW